MYWFEGPIGMLRLEQGEMEEDEKRKKAGSDGSIEKKVEDVRDEKQMTRD